tara:strand:+ start:533 stop:829 length:297 start_codon:yes stop_codon:yes gene_type:complete
MSNLNKVSNQVKVYEGYQPNEIAREIILNALNLAMEVDSNYATTELETINNEYDKRTTKAVRNQIKKYSLKLFEEFHTGKFDMSGHPIVEKFNEEEVA